MRLKKEIKILEKYNFLQECILKDIKWNDYCTNVDLTFNNIWTTDGDLRTDLNHERLLMLRFKFVQEFQFFGGLNKEHLLQPELINWGLNEISILRVAEESLLLKKYKHLKNELNHFSVVWEGDRKIDLVFRHLNIMEPV